MVWQVAENRKERGDAVSILKKTWATLVLGVAGATVVALLSVSPWWVLLVCLILLIGWMTATQVGRQTRAVTQIGIASIPQRLGSSCVVVVGIAGVVGVLVALLAMAAGFEATFTQTGTDDTVIVLQAGAQDEISSMIDPETAAVVAEAPQVLKNAQGRPAASAEILVVNSLPRRRGGEDGNVEIRGVGERAWDLRPNVKITAGRTWRTGLRELVLGKSVHEQFEGADVGSTLNFNGQAWNVVGIFDSADVHNSEIWGDLDVIGPAFHRGSSRTSLTLRLTDALAFDAFKAGLASDPRLKIDVQTTRQFYSRQSEELTHTIRILGAAVGAIMAVGAVFGALNTMYAAVATRTREIATLRAIGFQGVPVVSSILLETLLLAMLGGMIGAAIAWVGFDGFTASTMDIFFAFHVSPTLLASGLKWALAIGAIGGLFPAIRAVRMRVTAGLREL
jgi:putative ABC transport system permease protein